MLSSARGLEETGTWLFDGEAFFAFDTFLLVGVRPFFLLWGVESEARPHFDMGQNQEQKGYLGKLMGFSELGHDGGGQCSAVLFR